MSNQDQSNQNIPSWISNISDKEYDSPENKISQNNMARKMVNLVNKFFKERGISVLKGGRRVLFNAYKAKMKEQDKLPLQSGNNSPEEAALKLVTTVIDRKDDIFINKYKNTQHNRVGAVVAENIKLEAEKIAREQKVCPFWPFC